MDRKIKNFLEFYKKAEKLKATLRHSWLSDPKRQESVAEHSWMLGLMAMSLSGQLKKKVNLLKVMKMVTIHDLAEAITGDIPAYEMSKRNIKANKNKAELKALTKIFSTLPKSEAREFLSLWKEMENRKTPEAKFSQALDKLEVVLQHNIADISTWDEHDYRASPYHKDEYFDFDTFMRALRDVVNNQGMRKILKAGTIHMLDPKHLERYKKRPAKR